MASINKVILIGNLGRDPEMRHTQGGTAIAQLNIATTRVYTNKSNDRVEETEWHRVVVWGKQAESCAQYLTKGRQVYIEGRLQTRNYDDKDGVKKYVTEVVADVVQFLGGRREGDSSSDDGPRERQRSRSGSSSSSDEPPHGYDPSRLGPDDDIPF